MGDFYELFYDDAQRAGAAARHHADRTRRVGRRADSDGGRALPCGRAVSGEAGAARRIGRDLRADRRSGDRQGARSSARSHAWSRRERSPMQDCSMPSAIRCSSRCILVRQRVGLASAQLLGSDSCAFATWTPRTLAAELERIDPSELLLSRWQRRCAAVRTGAGACVAAVAASTPVRRRGAWQNSSAPAISRPLASRTRRSRCRRPARSLHYAQATQQAALAHVRSLVVEQTGEYVALDAATRRNLEITETLRGEPSPTLLSLLDGCATAAGSRLLRRWLSQPLRARDVASSRHAAIAELAASQPVRRRTRGGVEAHRRPRAHRGADRALHRPPARSRRTAGNALDACPRSAPR